jgi:hypothetical protein
MTTIGRSCGAVPGFAQASSKQINRLVAVSGACETPFDSSVNRQSFEEFHQMSSVQSERFGGGGAITLRVGQRSHD